MKRLPAAIFLTLLIGGVAIAQPAVPIDTWITLERTPCFGACPWYKLSISADGAVELIPKALDVDHREVDKPPFKVNIGVDKVKRLITEFEKINYFALNDEYITRNEEDCPSSWTDAPSAITSISTGGKWKRILHYRGCKGNPVLDKLTTLENKIDEIAGTEGWLKQLRTQ